jgi:hypothetical protein
MKKLALKLYLSKIDLAIVNWLFKVSPKVKITTLLLRTGLLPVEEMFDFAYMGYGSKNMPNVIEVKAAILHPVTFRRFFNPNLLGFLG